MEVILIFALAYIRRLVLSLSKWNVYILNTTWSYRAWTMSYSNVTFKNRNPRHHHISMPHHVHSCLKIWGHSNHQNMAGKSFLKREEAIQCSPIGRKPSLRHFCLRTPLDACVIVCVSSNRWLLKIRTIFGAKMAYSNKAWTMGEKYEV